VLAVITVFMAWKAKDVEMTYDFAQVVSPNDPDMVYFQQFKQRFGEDGNVLVLGLQDSSVYELGNFNELRLLTDTLAKVEGVNGVLSVSKLLNISKDTTKDLPLCTIMHVLPPGRPSRRQPSHRDAG
jgi:predicted RND superfamily exporter protein